MPISEVASESVPDLVGRVVLGRYRIVSPLARGGMGVVYLGRVEGSSGFAKPVVVKSVIAVLGGEHEGEQLFAREARTVANLQHPGIVGVIDFGQFESSHVMVLEYVHGFDFGKWMRFVNTTRGRIPVEQAVHVVLCVLDALSYAHELSRPDGKTTAVVHRDISPANVLIDAQGHVKLGDFGIARADDDEFKTQQGMFRGTLPFSAPETLQGGSVTPKVDQYACGVVLYRALAAQNPFKGEHSGQTVTRVLTLVPPSLSTVRDDVPSAIDAAIARALAKDPDERFASAEEFARALREGLEWSERDAAESFAKQIEKDFTGRMPEALGLESLAVRDAAWRDAQEAKSGSVSLSSSPPGMKSGTVSRSESRARDTLDPPEKPAEKSEAGGTGNVGPSRERRIGPWILLGALAIGGLVGAAILLKGNAGPEPAARVLVLEKQAAEPSPEPAASAPTAPPAESPPPEPVASPGVASPRALQGAPVQGASNRAAVLARAFQKQEGPIQRCYQQNPSDVGKDAQIAVRFRIDEKGAVQTAVVTPAAVAGTPLGACIARVARGTSFGPQPEPISFAIPIATRVVKR